MGKKESDLIPFLERGLKSQKYGQYLVYFEQRKNILRLSLPRLTSKISSEPVQILKDWYKEKNREDFSYSKAKQAIIAALKKSVYLEHVHNERYPLLYRILKPEEVKKKRKKEKESKNDSTKLKPSKSLDYDSPSSVESGYSSIADNENEISFSSSIDILQENITSMMSTEDCNQYPKISLLSVKHDHDFGFTAKEDLEKGKSAVCTNGDVLENDCDFLNKIPDSEWKVYLEDLVEDLPTLDDFYCKDNATKTKIYKYKEDLNVEENSLMIILESEEKYIYEEDSDSNITIMLDFHMLQKIQVYKLIKSVFVGNYLQLFFKFPESGN